MSVVEWADRSPGQVLSFVQREPLLTLIIIVLAAMLVQLLVGLATGGIRFDRFMGRMWRGLIHGLIIGLAGIGLSLTYSILNFANVGHGDYITAGGYVGFGVAFIVAGFGEHSVTDLFLVGGGVERVTGTGLELSLGTTPIAVAIGLIGAMVLTVAVTLIIDRVVYKPIRGAGPISLLIISIGVAFALRYIIAFVYGTRSVSAVWSGGIDRWTTPLGFSTNVHDLTVIVMAAVLMLGLHVLLQQTKLGKAMRAMSDNEDLALITGIPTEHVIRWTWIIGGALTGAAGYLFVLWRGTLSFQFGWFLLLIIFAAVILGGIGSIYGAIGGGLVIGFVFELSPLWIPDDFQRAAAFMVMILILLYRPQGIFGGKTTA